ncbi:MAG TPA: exodeoxyribonuclease VII large subunit [Verrucomicrobiota bacterium]|nr:exodeoxyribonuclease VII large subunit [Verrucomicrobiales bacterium]HRI13924.1 exodeoxyribonuclease VII large subunit [Verrucomicrobiota bacterium]
MPTNPKTQWDFGDLFAPKSPVGPATAPRETFPLAVEPRTVLSVTEFTLRIKRQLERSFTSVFVSGEVSNWRLQASGHAYFVLKDAEAQLNCVLFRSQSGADRARIKDGTKVTVGGELTVYEPRGQYQLRVMSVEIEGVGALQAAFERLKARLHAEGLFDPARKRPIPQFPRRVGLITSPTGAAIRDVLHVVERRYAGIEFIFVPVRVQGDGAAASMADALNDLNTWARSAPGGLDVILITRGGGSLEDLWAFNEEVLARAITASAIPIISAVGHEIDFTIADFAADLRAATPSAAAEILTAAYVASRDQVKELARRLGWLWDQQFARSQDQLSALVNRLTRAHPRRQLELRSQRLDDAVPSLGRRVRQRLRDLQLRAENNSRRLTTRRPVVVIGQRLRQLDELRRRLRAAARQHVDNATKRFQQASQSLVLLSPMNVLQRGYSLTFDAETGQLIRLAEDVEPGQRLRTRLAEGEIESVVTEPKLLSD